MGAAIAEAHVTSRTRVNLQPAFLLHQRDYRDSSRLLEALTRDRGRVGLVARGIRAPRSRLRGVLQPFQPLLLSWAGGGELGTLTGAELSGGLPPLAGDRLMAAYYASELILRLLQRHDPHPGAFAAYAAVLADLAHGSAAEPGLRLFELQLLRELGYGLDLQHEAEAGKPVAAGLWYRFESERGLVATIRSAPDDEGFPGRALLALAHGRLSDPEDLRHAKRLLRQVLSTYLGHRPLRTRTVWHALRRSESRGPEPASDRSEEAHE